MGKRTKPRQFQIKKPQVDLDIWKKKTLCLKNIEDIMDPVGYFLIRINKSWIEVGICNYSEINKINWLWCGKLPQNIYKKIIVDIPDLSKTHCAYLGKELARAYICLKLRAKYVQDGKVDGSFLEVEMIKNAHV